MLAGQCPVSHREFELSHHRTPMTDDHSQPDLYVTRTSCVTSLLLYRMMMQCMAHALLTSTAGSLVLMASAASASKY